MIRDMRGLAIPFLALVLAACQAGSPSTDTQPSAAVASTSAQASITASASPTASPTPMPEPEVLAPGSQAVVLVDSLQLREEPGLATPVRTTMPAGDVVYLIGPPFAVSADGYTWRHVAYASGYQGWPVNPGATWFSGWAAASGPDGSLLGAMPVSCPDAPITVEKLIRLPEWDRARCFGGRELTFRARVVTGFGGYIQGTFEPSWLAHPMGFGGALGSSEGYLLYRQRSPGTAYVDGELLEVTGHFNDPAAQRCSVAVGDPPVPEPEDLAVAYCQGLLVVTSTTLLDG
jgi:hypothetical protein